MENLINDLNAEYPTDIVSKFSDIAEKLMCSYIIKKGESRFALVEIEFYYHSPSHPDIITYPRNLKGGRWFFHQSGVDLTFNSESAILDKNGNISNPEEAIFGGILIRGLYDIDKREYTFGPHKCMDILWQDLNAFSEFNESPVLERVSDELILNCIQEFKRCINIEKGTEITKVKEWAKRVGKKVDDMLETELQYEFDKIIDAKYRFFNLQNDEDPCCFMQIPSKARPKKV